MCLISVTLRKKDSALVGWTFMKTSSNWRTPLCNSIALQKKHKSSAEKKFKNPIAITMTITGTTQMMTGDNYLSSRWRQATTLAFRKISYRHNDSLFHLLNAAGLLGGRCKKQKVSKATQREHYNTGRILISLPSIDSLPSLGLPLIITWLLLF